jgi:hypothetical protein
MTISPGRSPLWIRPRRSHRTGLLLHRTRRDARDVDRLGPGRDHYPASTVSGRRGTATRRPAAAIWWRILDQLPHMQPPRPSRRQAQDHNAGRAALEAASDVRPEPLTPPDAQRRPEFPQGPLPELFDMYQGPAPPSGAAGLPSGPGRETQPPTRSPGRCVAGSRSPDQGQPSTIASWPFVIELGFH